MTTQYSPQGQTIEDIMTDQIGRLNGVNDADWLSAIEQWQQNHHSDDPFEPVWFRIRPAGNDHPVDVKIKLYRGGWLFMAAFQGQDDPEYPPDEYEDEPNTDGSYPMLGRAVINFPSLPGFDEEDYL